MTGLLRLAIKDPKTLFDPEKGAATTFLRAFCLN
jgi:hypothetical protein